MNEFVVKDQTALPGFPRQRMDFIAERGEEDCGPILGPRASLQPPPHLMLPFSFFWPPATSSDLPGPRQVGPVKCCLDGLRKASDPMWPAVSGFCVSVCLMFPRLSQSPSEE